MGRRSVSCIRGGRFCVLSVKAGRCRRDSYNGFIPITAAREITMNTRFANPLRFSALAAAVLLAGCSIHITEGERGNGTARHVGWNLTIDSHTSFGNHRTKGSGVVRDETRQVAGTSRLVLAVPADVTVVQSATDSVTITTDDNILPLVRTRVENGVLTIDGDKNAGFSTRKGIKVRLAVKSLEGVIVNGSGDVNGTELAGENVEVAIRGSGDVRFEVVKAGKVSVDIAGSGDVAINEVTSRELKAAIHGSGDIKLPAIKATEVAVSVRGSGDISAAGSADKVDVEIMGSGDVRTARLISREANVRISSSGEAHVHATEKLVARVSGSGDIRYGGSPANVDRVVRGSGSIEQL